MADSLNVYLHHMICGSSLSNLKGCNVLKGKDLSAAAGESKWGFTGGYMWSVLFTVAEEPSNKNPTVKPRYGFTAE